MASIESNDDEDSPYYGLDRRGESHKSLPHHDSLRELELKEADQPRSKYSSGEDNINISGSSIGRDNNELLMVEPNPSPASLSTTPDPNASLLEGGVRKDDKEKKKGNIVAAADIEISPQEQLHLQDKLDPEIHRVKEKKTSKIKKFRKKPVKEDKTPRRIYFNDPARNASFKYL